MLFKLQLRSWKIDFTVSPCIKSFQRKLVGCGFGSVKGSKACWWWWSPRYPDSFFPGLGHHHHATSKEKHKSMERHPFCCSFCKVFVLEGAYSRLAFINGAFTGSICSQPLMWQQAFPQADFFFVHLSNVLAALWTPLFFGLTLFLKACPNFSPALVDFVSMDLAFFVEIWLAVYKWFSSSPKRLSAMSYSSSRSFLLELFMWPSGHLWAKLRGWLFCGSTLSLFIVWFYIASNYFVGLHHPLFFCGPTLSLVICVSSGSYRCSSAAAQQLLFGRCSLVWTAVAFPGSRG